MEPHLLVWRDVDFSRPCSDNIFFRTHLLRSLYREGHFVRQRSGRKYAIIPNNVLYGRKVAIPNNSKYSYNGLIVVGNLKGGPLLDFQVRHVAVAFSWMRTRIRASTLLLNSEVYIHPLPSHRFANIL